MPQSSDSSSDSDEDITELEKIKDAVCGTRNCQLFCYGVSHGPTTF